MSLVLYYVLFMAYVVKRFVLPVKAHCVEL